MIDTNAAVALARQYVSGRDLTDEQKDVLDHAVRARFTGVGGQTSDSFSLIRDFALQVVSELP